MDNIVVMYLKQIKMISLHGRHDCDMRLLQGVSAAAQTRSEYRVHVIR